MPPWYGKASCGEESCLRMVLDGGWAMGTTYILAKALGFLDKEIGPPGGAFGVEREDNQIAD